jgi:hypothetical protein
MRVYKFPIPVEDSGRIEMPKGAKILKIQVQHGTPCMWALVDSKAPKEMREFRIVGTGQHIELSPYLELTYIGTFQVNGGHLVFHVFEDRVPNG